MKRMKPLTRKARRRTEELLRKVSLEEDLIYLVLNWDDDGVVEKGLFGLKGSTLGETIVALRALSSLEDPPTIWVAKAAKFLTTLFSRDCPPLSAAGCL